MSTRAQAQPKAPTLDPAVIREALAAPALRFALEDLHRVVKAMGLPSYIERPNAEEIDAAMLQAERALAMARG